MARPYDSITIDIPGDADRTARMRVVVDAMWDALRDSGVSWAGFYLHEGGDELVLGPRQPKPACSPIGLHGACGRALASKEPLVVKDVAELGEGYIACDPRDRSEVVIPLVESDGRCWGVLDLDSHDVGAFDESDVAGLVRLVRSSGLLKLKVEVLQRIFWVQSIRKV